VIVALGHEATAVLGTDDRLTTELMLAGEAVGERLWPLPLWPEYDEMLQGQFADLKNVGDGSAGTIAGGAFLKQFAPAGVPWGASGRRRHGLAGNGTGPRRARRDLGLRPPAGGMGRAFAAGRLRFRRDALPARPVHGLPDAGARAERQHAHRLRPRSGGVPGFPGPPRPAGIQETQRRDILDFLMAGKQKGLAAASLARRLVAIKVFFRHLASEGLLATNVADAMESPRLWKILPPTLSVEEVERLLAAPNAATPRGLRDRAILETFYATGLRVSELAALALDSLHLEAEYVRCVGKGDKERVVPIAGGRSRRCGLAGARPARLCGQGRRREPRGLPVAAGPAADAPDPVAADPGLRAAGGHRQGHFAARAAAFVRLASAGPRRVAAGDPGNAGPRRHRDHADLHARGPGAPAVRPPPIPPEGLTMDADATFAEQAELERRLGHAFRRPDLLAAALTHRSHSAEAGQPEQAENQRLEFLGDAVLGAISAEWLVARRSDWREGTLTKVRSRLTNAAALARVARRLELGCFLRLGRGEERSGGRDKETLLADALEALLARCGSTAAPIPSGRSSRNGSPTKSRRRSRRRRRRQSQRRIAGTAAKGGAGAPRYVVLPKAAPPTPAISRWTCSRERRNWGRGPGPASGKPRCMRRASRWMLGVPIDPMPNP
jgi:hypothetical protein